MGEVKKASEGRVRLAVGIAVGKVLGPESSEVVKLLQVCGWRAGSEEEQSEPWKLDRGQTTWSLGDHWVFILKTVGCHWSFSSCRWLEALIRITHIKQIAQCLANFKCSLNGSCYCCLLIIISLSKHLETEVGRGLESQDHRITRGGLCKSGNCHWEDNLKVFLELQASDVRASRNTSNSWDTCHADRQGNPEDSQGLLHHICGDIVTFSTAYARKVPHGP